jgi:hypothetical protein
MNENFKQTLIKQYSEVIEEMIIESETVYRSSLDYNELDIRVHHLIKAAVVDGLEESIIWSLLERRVPDYYLFACGSSPSTKIKIAA